MSNNKQNENNNAKNQFSNTEPLTHAQRVAIANTISNNKQSSVEWLIGQLKISTYWNTLIAELEFMDLEIDDIIEQAKEMHNQEIKEAWDNAAIDASYGNKFRNFEQYYNEKFNNQQ